MGDIKAIETVYAGCKFRSRLEARWAVFFDEAGLTWDYEPEGYHDENGCCYLPDFYLPEPDVYAEVKGTYGGHEEDVLRLQEFIQQDSPIRKVVILGNIPNVSGGRGLWYFPTYCYDESSQDDCAGCGWSCFCDIDDRVTCVTSHEGSKPPILEENLGKGDFSIAARAGVEVFGRAGRGAVPQTKKTARALSKARRARFEHGQTPQPKRGPTNLASRVGANGSKESMRHDAREPRTPEERWSLAISEAEKYMPARFVKLVKASHVVSYDGKELRVELRQGESAFVTHMLRMPIIHKEFENLVERFFGSRRVTFVNT